MTLWIDHLRLDGSAPRTPGRDMGKVGKYFAEFKFVFKFGPKFLIFNPFLCVQAAPAETNHAEILRAVRGKLKPEMITWKFPPAHSSMQRYIEDFLDGAFDRAGLNLDGIFRLDVAQMVGH